MRWLAVMVLVLSCSRDDGRSGDMPSPLVNGESTLPPWFGLPDAPPRRIAGVLLDGETPVAGVVHLRIYVPDPTVWTGLERKTGADGRFDFGELRAGRYLILATTPGESSRLVLVDTTTAAAASLSIYAYPCSMKSRTVRADGRLVSGAQVDVGGVVMATTDTTGSYSICIPPEAIWATIRTPGFAAQNTSYWPDGPDRADAEIVEGLGLQGEVLGTDGKPAIGVGVQPIVANAMRLDHGGEYPEPPTQATTDASGRFVIRWVTRLYPAAFDGGPAQQVSYYFRIIDGDRVFEDTSAVVSEDNPSRAQVVMRLPVSPPPRETNAKLSGRITHDGRPLADAAVTAFVEAVYMVGFGTRTAPDGSFSLDVRGDGPMTVEVEHANGLSTRRIVHISPGQTTVVGIEVSAAGSIAGAAYDARGNPLADSMVWACARDTAVCRYAQTGADGSFSVAHLEVGHTYDIDMLDDDEALAEVRLDASNPNPTGLRVTGRDAE